MPDHAAERLIADRYALAVPIGQGGMGVVWRARDVKPANVMVVGDGAKLTDFGIARVKGDPKLTSTGLIVGSPAYMAPEQASGAAAGPEADMWSLGATLYYAVEGRPPFERDGQIAVMTAVVNDPP